MALGDPMVVCVGWHQVRARDAQIEQLRVEVRKLRHQRTQLADGAPQRSGTPAGGADIATTDVEPDASAGGASKKGKASREQLEEELALVQAENEELSSTVRHHVRGWWWWVLVNQPVRHRVCTAVTGVCRWKTCCCASSLRLRARARVLATAPAALTQTRPKPSR